MNNEGDLVCYCMSVTRGEILEALHNGNHTIEQLKREVSCCTGCGTCEIRVQKIIEGWKLKAKQAS